MTGPAALAPDPRRALAEARRVVVKLGSRALVPRDGAPQRFGPLAAQVAALGAADRDVVVVSSGAIALGRARLGLAERPKALERLQAAAAVGQSCLMDAWSQAFAPLGRTVAQVLLSHADLADRERYLLARDTIESLLDLGAVPIVNENDTVAVDEIRFGDNDQLAAMVATLVRADLLVLLTNVPGLLDAAGAPVPTVHADDATVDAWVGEGTSDAGTGGMFSKLSAARRAAERGIPVAIAEAGAAEVLPRLLAGEALGTIVLPKGAPLASRKHWIAYTLRPRGAVVVDAGAVAALGQGRSLLPAGVLGVRGAFDAGDAVAVVGPDGREVARGLVRYGLADVARLAGARSGEIAERLRRRGDPEIVHRDDLVWLEDRARG